MTDQDILDGQIILIDKPLDWTSFQAVNKLKYKLRKQFDLPKKFKIGHAGTLDPKATGLLIVCTGKFTKRISEIQDAPKEYRTEIKLGFQTESYDTEKPEILPKDISKITEENIFEVLSQFIGEIEQKPPIFSAVKIDGKRAYSLARAGEEVVTRSRTIIISHLSEIEIDLPFVSFTVGCSKGTYIRSLANDIGEKLEVGAYLTKLRRTKIGDYFIENANEKCLENEFEF
ncbi:tRNA pseudouridine(55) synthase TruB [Halpernia sp. GG3]